MSSIGPAMVRAMVPAMVPTMVGLILALGCTALAGAADQPSGAADCRGIADANARLACFDRGACRDIADSAARRACFDRAAVPAPKAAPPVAAAAPAPAAVPAPAPVTARVAPVPVTPSAPVAAPAPAAAAAPVTAPMAPEQRFGLPEHKVVQKEVEAGARDKDASKIQAQIVRLEPAADQRMVFTLDNAQVWRQLSAEGDLLAKPGDTVTISRGLFGSYWLQAPTGRGSKVSRLR